MSDSLRVGYVLKQYPRLSETFILNEILGLEQRGVDVTVFSLRHATEGRFHPGISAVRGQVHYLRAADRTAFFAALQALPNLKSDQLPRVLAFVDRLAEPRRASVVLHAIELARLAVEADIEHVHAHFLTIAAQTAHLVWLLTGIPYTVTAHAKDVYRHAVDWDLAAAIARDAATVITVCDANLHYLAHRLDGSGARLVRVYNGLGPQDPPTPVVNRHQQLVLGVGRMVEKKGFDLLLESMADLAPRHPEIRCVLIGDGDCRATLENQARDLDIDHLVFFAGALPQDQVARWMRRAAIMVAPCRVGADGNQDALPTVLLEALGAGLPAVTTPVAGIPEIITDGIEGLIVPCDDVGSLTAATEKVLTDRELQAAMASAGPAKLAASFDRSQTIVQLIDIFRSRERV